MTVKLPLIEIKIFSHYFHIVQMDPKIILNAIHGAQTALPDKCGISFALISPKRGQCEINMIH